MTNIKSPEKFSDLKIDSQFCQVAEELGYKTLTPIQAASIPLLLSGKDLLGQSKTGSGKTAAFSLPILQNIDLQNKHTQALILCPTRELSQQVAREIRKFGRKMEGLTVLLVVGGEPTRAEQAQALRRGVHIVVGTPGRVLDLLERQRFDLQDMSTLVFDEADEMLDMGFEDEIRGIMEFVPQQRQTVFFSATFPDKIKALSKQFQKNPMTVVIEEPQSEMPKIDQYLYEFNPADKASGLMRVLQKHSPRSAIIFVNLKNTAKELQQQIAQAGASVGALHGDLEQRDRELVMAMFRNKTLRFLVATDVAARGLDVEDLDLVVNYDLPNQAESYVHRIGRTGRAGKTGTAVTLIVADEAFRLSDLQTSLGLELQKPALGFQNQFGLSAELKEAMMVTIAIEGGRKSKLRPGDILGALTGESGGLVAADIGKIEILDWVAYVAVSASSAQRALSGLREGKIKGQKFPVRMLTYRDL